MPGEGKGERLTVEGTMLPHTLRTYSSDSCSVRGTGGGNLISLPPITNMGSCMWFGSCINSVEVQKRFLCPWQGALHREGSWCCEQACARAFRCGLSGGEFPAVKKIWRQLGLRRWKNRAPLVCAVQIPAPLQRSRTSLVCLGANWRWRL